MNERKIPMRKCIGCQRMLEKGKLIRIIRSPEGEISLDRTGRANGRGAYLCKDTACLQKARKNKGLERSLQCRLPEDIWETLQQELL